MATSKLTTTAQRLTRRGFPRGPQRKQHIFLDGIEGKICPACQEWKALSQFGIRKFSSDGLSSSCTPCTSRLAKQARDRDIEGSRETKRAWREKNPEKLAEYALRHGATEKSRERAQRRMERDPEGEREKMRKRKQRQYDKDPERFKQRVKAWNDANPDYAIFYKSQPQQRIHSNMSRGIRSSLQKSKNGYKWESLVGYTREDLILHLEGLFQEGMTWDNYGEWEIDHIRPLASFTFLSYEDEDFITCWALANLQPLWQSANRKKWAHYADTERDAPGIIWPCTDDA